MIIDADVHISPYNHNDPYSIGGDISIDELLRRMDHAGVDMAVTWLRPPYMRDITESNKYVYDAMKAHPDRIIGFGWADPHLGQKKMFDEIRRCHEDYGMQGIKLNGAQNDFYIDGEFAAPFVEAVAETGLVIAFHTGVDAYEATHPFRLGKLAKAYPESRMFMIHMGGVAFHDLSTAAIEVMQECPNIMGIASAIRHINVLKALKALGTDRIAFGSDTPFNLMHVELAAFDALLNDEFSQEDKAAVMSQNIVRFLGLT